MLIGAGGAPVRFRSCKHLALLIYLHLEGRDRGAAREVLIDLLWPGVAPNPGRHSLSQALTVLRAELGPSVVSRGGDAVRLLEPVETDLDRLTVASAGSWDLQAPLAGLEHCAGPDFGHWVDAARARLTRIAADLLRGQLSAARVNGNATLVHERAQLLYEVDPLSDLAVKALAEKHLLSEDGVGAIRLLRGHSERVRRELGCDPHPELQRLARRLECGVRPLRTPPIEDVQGTSTRQPPPVFIGREREMARLESLWAHAEAGRLVTCLITGTPGVGKSSLIERFSASVIARTWPAYTITCQEIGRDIPFAVVADLLYALGRDPQTSGADPEWLGEASRLAPGLRTSYPGIAKPPAVAPEAVKLRAAEAIAHIIGVVGDGGPVFLALDNVQHIDPVSVAILHLVLRRLDQSPLLVLGSARSAAQLPASNGPSVDSLAWKIHQPLAPLSSVQSDTLLQTLTSAAKRPLPRAVQQKIVELAQGIPYLIEMLASDWLESADGSLVTAELLGRDALHRWQPPEMMTRAFARQYSEDRKSVV